MEKLPEQYYVIATNNDEAKIMQEFVNALDGNSTKWTILDCQHYYLHIQKGLYNGGNRFPKDYHTKISFQDFQRLVLKQYDTYEIF